MRILVAFCLVVCSHPGAFAQCRAPHYHAAYALVDSSSEFIGSISIPLRDFAPARLVCLAASLKERYRGRNSIVVNVFSSGKAASINLTVRDYNKGELEAYAQMHGQYVLDTAKHEEYVSVKPEGIAPMFTDRPSDTKINLPVAAAPHCRLEIDNRCLIASQEVAYPYELKGEPSGHVTLTGTVTRSGKVSHVRVAKAESVPEEAKDVLTNAAVQNLSSWRLEPGSRQAAIKITYSYVIDKSLGYKGASKVDWALPNEVTIRWRPE